MPAPSKRFDLVPPYLFGEISRLKNEAIANGADVVDLGIGDPDIPTDPSIVEALYKAAQNPATHRYDETPRGWVSFLEAAAKWYKREFGVELDPKNDILELIGSKEGLGHLVWAYIDEGDYAILTDPGYPAYKSNVIVAGGSVYEAPLTENNKYLPILSDIPTDIAKKAKLFFVCYPNNPTGAVATKAFYQDAVAFCKEHDILLVNDMAYAGIAYDDYKNPTVMQVEGAQDIAIEFHSLSKTFNMTGWRIGFALGNHDALAALGRMKSYVDSKQFPAVAEAAAHALVNVDNSDSVAIYQRRRDNLCDGLNSIGWKVEKPVSSFYVWAKIPRTDMTSAEFAAELMKRTNVLVIPGTGYGPTGEGYVRMSLTLPGDKNGERFTEAVRRIQESGLLPALV